MKLRLCFSLMMMAVMCSPVKAQLYSSRLFYEYRVTVGHNLRLPGNAGQGTIAIVNKDKDRLYRKFMVGGFTGGISGFNNIDEKLDIKWTANISRQVFFAQAIQFNNGPNQQNALGYTNPVIAEYYLGFNGIAHYRPGEKFSMGAGAGFELLLSSVTSFPYAASTDDKPVSYRNREFKPVMPVAALELLWREERFSYNIRYEIGLANRYKTALKDFGPNRFHTISFEIGMKIWSDSE